MCGFAGFIASQKVDSSESTLLRMAEVISHRGPDDAGIWMDDSVCIGLAHRRLSIVDLSAAGHQPMRSSSGRYIIAFNGEIYNHTKLRSQLRMSQWKGYSDTETLLAGFDTWGIESTVRRVVGMFAFAVWDIDERILTLGRDRLGEKPIYYGWQGSTFLFGSELKALRAHPSFAREIDRDSLTLQMRHSAVPAPYSIYRGIKKLMPGSLLSVSTKKQNAQPRQYWDASEVVATGISQPYHGTHEDAVAELDNLLKNAVAQQMISDVPLGAFLSGGVDSSVVVALMQAQSNNPVKTFSIGFDEKGYNEAIYASAVANHLGTQHTELYLTSQQLMDVVPRLPAIYDEPFSDPSQIPTLLVSELAKQHVKVSLSGDGGDELFGGYNRYLAGQRLWAKVSCLPVKFRKQLAKIICMGSPNFWNRLLAPAHFALPESLRQINVGERMHKAASAITANSSIDLYQKLISNWSEPEALVLNSKEPSTSLTKIDDFMDVENFVQQMMALDMVGYLPDDVLTKLDRAAMAVSLETRVPLLDHRIVEFAWQLPLNYKIRNGVGKWPLREVLYKYVPRKLIDRPKMGFAVPIDSWLRKPLLDWAENLLDESRLRHEGFFNEKVVRHKWKEHLSGQRNWQYQLWDVLMFQAWLEQERSA